MMPVATEPGVYARKKETERERNAWHSLVGRDIAAEYPKTGDLEARKACEGDLKLFLEWYFPAAFPLPWSADHLRAIERMQEIILRGGLLALAMPRGSGKTTLCIRATIWAMLYGHRRSVTLLGATQKHAEDYILAPLKVELTLNERLGADFRQVCYPLSRLEGNARKAPGQIMCGQPTRIEWATDALKFPTVPRQALDEGCKDVSGSAVFVAGLTGAIRGPSVTLPTGEVIRPELVLLDDPQTRESAMSPSQSETRTRIVQADVLGLAGPGSKIAAFMPCTVIRKGDMADRMLDRELNPEWGGQKTKMVYSFPRDEGLWDQYWEIRSGSLRADRDGSEATEFYRQHRGEMDLGSSVAWPERHNPDEISAIQHAQNLKFRDKYAFFAEYQNDPLPDVEPRPDDLTPDQVAGKVNRMRRGEIPIACNRLTAFVDVQASLLYYVVAAWEDDFTGYVVDYGTFPEQKTPYFTLRDAKYTLASVFPSSGLEGQIYAGLESLWTLLMAREWTRDDGVLMKIDRGLTDANWGVSTKVVYQFCRQSRYASVLMPSHGRYIGASSLPMRDYQKRPGESIGFNWMVTAPEDRKTGVRKVTYDTNFWKTFAYIRLSTGMGDRGCLSLFGDDKAIHALFADHLVSEFRVRTVGRGREVDEWKLKPERPDNHWFDCLVGCLVAASMSGVVLAETKSSPAPKPARVSFAELQRKRRA